MKKEDDIRQSGITYIEKKFSGASKYEKEKILNDWLGKECAAKGVLLDFQKRVGDPAGKKVLDIGFGNGIILSTFASADACVYGVEIDKMLVSIAKKLTMCSDKDNRFLLYDGITLPFPDNYFDYIYSTSVLEHTSFPEKMLREAHRVLRPGGKFYLAFPNKFYYRETHTGVWFVSYLPRFLAVRLLKLFARSSLEDWNLHFLSYFDLKRILALNNIPFSVLFEIESDNLLKKIVKKSLRFFGIHHSALLPHIMVILKK